jgi:hypothetical protein
MNFIRQVIIAIQNRDTFVSIASQKNFIAFYHIGMYAKPKLLKWFQSEYLKHSSAKLDMGKSCVSFKKPEHIPYKLIGELVKKNDSERLDRML